jgi:DNA-binding NarL/FixJ family response regulator
VLIVDPHASFRFASKAFLQTEGFAVVADLERWEGADDAVKALRPDVMLIDVSPWETEGLELARRLSALEEPPAIVLMSAASSDTILAASAGADLFLGKASINADAIAHAARKQRPLNEALVPTSNSATKAEVKSGSDGT